MHPILILLLGMATVLGAIVVLRLNAFLALITAAILVSLLAPGEVAGKIPRVAEAFGRTVGNIGIVIALAAIIGKAMMDSGAADRIVLAFLNVLGEKRAATALEASGFVLAVPVFFDTVFYLLVPLARSMYRRTKRNYLKYLMAVAAGGAATHALVPPTPGPLAVAGTLGVDVGMMILVGSLVALPGAIVGLWFAGWVDRRMPVPLRTEAVGVPVPSRTEAAGVPVPSRTEAAGAPVPLRTGAAGVPERLRTEAAGVPVPLRTEAAGVPEPEPAEPPKLPGLVVSVLPILLPVILISANTVAASLVAADTREGTPGAGAPGAFGQFAAVAATLGNANLALLLSAAVALLVYRNQRRPSRAELAGAVESALMSGGVIILITAAGGAFGAMLQVAQIGPEIQALFAGEGRAPGMMYLFVAFAVASLMKIAQGSSTVAMITTAAMLAAMMEGGTSLPFHPVYVATAIAGGSLVGSWMNDSGFWVYTKMGGLTEVEGLKSWTPLLMVIGITAMLMTLLLALVLPLAPGPVFRS